VGSTKKDQSGWGNLRFESCHVVQPHSLAAVQQVVTDGEHRSYICRGLGRSYGDSAVNRDEGVILQTGLNRFLDFDEATGVLECEAGVSFAEIMDVFLPRGWFLKTTPGTKYVTVGGAIAADVHGKNHHRDGSFGNFVLSLELLTAAGEVLSCSPSENEDVFWATIGGMGLTGVVLSARIQLAEVESAYCKVRYRRTANLDESLDFFESTDRDYRHSVAWVDCLASGKSLGRSVLMLGNEAAAAELPPRLRNRPLTIPAKRGKSVPFCFPGVVLNSYSVRAFNWLFYARHRDGHRFVDYDTYFYPLDAVSHWNRVYGKRGFIQYQALFPPQTSRRGLIELLEVIAKSRKASFLAVLKRSGPASQGMLSYLRPGHTLALDFKNTGEDLRRLVQHLDNLVLKHGGRLYLAKDAMTSPEAFRCMYERLDEFRKVKRRIDPDNRFASSQARRLGIVDCA
jgi:FAD/FMN-containing dehydrogenase